MGNIIDELGPLALGARLRRLLDTAWKDMTQIYQEHDLQLESKDFILFYLLGKRGQLSISEIAQELGLTHPAVIHLAKGLEKIGYVQSVKSADDNRKRYLKLTRKGKADLEGYEELWKDVETLNKEIFIDQLPFLQIIMKLEAMFEERSYYKRYQDIKNRKS